MAEALLAFFWHFSEMSEPPVLLIGEVGTVVKPVAPALADITKPSLVRLDDAIEKADPRQAVTIEQWEAELRSYP